MEQEAYREVGKIMRGAMQRRRDRPNIAVLEYMGDKLKEAKLCNIEPNWHKIFKESRKIWWNNL